MTMGASAGPREGPSDETVFRGRSGGVSLCIGGGQGIATIFERVS